MTICTRTILSASSIPTAAPLFQTQTFIAGKTDWAEWTNEENLSRNDFRGPWTQGTLEAVAPYRHRLRLFKSGASLAPGLTTHSVAGHAAGMVAYIFESEGQKVMFTGDLAHHQVFDPHHPEWFFHMDYDTDPALGAAAKAEVFAKGGCGEYPLPRVPFPLPRAGRSLSRRRRDLSIP